MMHPEIEQAMQTGYPTIEYMDYERNFSRENFRVLEGKPIEDMYGSPIESGDAYFIDEDKQVVHVENLRDYLTDVIGVVFYEAK